MYKKINRLALIGLASAGLFSACAGEIDTGDETVADDGASIISAKPGAALSSRAGGAAATVKEFVRGRAKGRAADQLRQTGEGRSVDGKRTHIRMEQIADGLRVHGAYVKATLDEQGQLVHVVEKVAASNARAPGARIKERQALERALAELGYEASNAGPASGQNGNVTHFGKGSTFHRDPSVERVAYVDAGGALAEGFLVETWSARGNQLDHTLVSGDGDVVSTERRTNNDRYNVFREDPAKTPQEVVTGPGGWLGAGAQTSTNITGNNAHAYLDVDANNAPDTGGTAVTDGDFLTAANLSVAPTTAGNRAVAVQNLFYLNNVTHDILYGHGFDEAAGNFQADNFGLGGAGNDAVNAEAQDGSGTDNANFATPADGSAPRMQMYLWTGSGPNAFVFVNAGLQYGAYQSSFGGALTAAGTAAAPVAAASPADACTAPAAGSLSGKIALVDRGTCDFTVKVLNAQKAGAVAVIIANNVPSNPFSPGGTNRKVKIPSVMVSQADGATLRSTLPSASLKKNTVAPLQIDGDIDADIVYHEYGHGLSWRMIGSMSGAIPGAIGEGASDTVAFLINGDDRIGEYAYSDPLGIRRAPYDAYTLTYKDVTGAEVHNDGEIYAAAMWQVSRNYLAAGLTASDVLDDFVDGMNYTPAAPSFEAMRDGMAQAAGSARSCHVYRGFAKLGIGVGSKATISRRGVVTITQSFAVPAGCPAP